MSPTTRLRFRRANRIRRARDFQRCYREGSRARGKDLLVVVVPNGEPVTRLGLSVGRRIWRGAVQRNRVRRVFREAFRLALPELPAGLDVVMIPARPALAPGTEEVRQELLALVRRALARRAEQGRREAAR